MISYLLGAVIFGYAGWTLLRFFKKSREGHCSTCSMKDGCQVSCNPTILK